MSRQLDPNNSELHVGDCFHGYCIQRIEALDHIRSYYYELEHSATGAKHIHVSNDDAENAFSVAFKTVPTDSSGVAHILEHTVLCGSRKFPVRDPFFAMLKRSLNTFMNAFTSSDWTMYPFCTQNRKDFHNLLDVYLDATFFPVLDELSFKQEGHRLEFEDHRAGDQAEQTLAYKGVVYNEMKGAMSSPDQVMVRSILHALYPDTTYRFNSGGDPKVIPTLTYQQLKAFHQTHYHPSNAYFYTYGNLPLKEHLAAIDASVLQKFKRIDPHTDVPSQPRWQTPRRETYYYPLQPDEDPSQKCQVCVAWLTADVRNTFEVLVLGLLEQILLGNAASPLRKALIDSKLGSALCDGAGFDADNRDTLFVGGLKDVKAQDADRIESLIFEVINDLVSSGIDKELVESAIHQIEFHRREITNTPYPFGLKLFLSFAGSWFHGADPTNVLKFQSDLEKIREAAMQDRFFEERLQKHFLDNLHRVRLILEPDQQLEQKEDLRVKSELAKIGVALGTSEIQQIKQDTHALLRRQEAEEDVSGLPTLQREDILLSVPSVAPSAYDSRHSIHRYKATTSGIFYFTVAFGAGKIPSQLIPLVPFYCYAFSKLGTSRHDYAEMARRIDATTGGLGLATHSRNRYDKTGDCVPFVTLGGKCLNRNLEAMFDIVQEFISALDFSDIERLGSLLRQYRAGLESMVVHGGARLALSAASRNFSITRMLSESWNGIQQLLLIKKLSDNLNDEKLSELSRDLTEIGRIVLTQQNFQAAVIGENECLGKAESLLVSIYDDLKGGQEGGYGPPEMDFDKRFLREGWSTASAVSFVAQAFETVPMTHVDAPALAISAKMLRSLFLHREIREKGGAYGGFALYNPEDGIFCFGSYRDPHIVSTLKTYEAAADFILGGSFNDEDVKEAILQVCSDIDKPDPPGPAAKKAFYRRLIDLSDDTRLQFKKRLLATTRSDVLEVAGKYFRQESGQKSVAVVSGEEKLKSANQKLAGDPLVINKI